MAKCGPSGYLKLFFEPSICSTIYVCEASRLLCVPVYIHGQVWWWWYNVISHHKKNMKLFWHASMSSIFVREACYWLINKTAASRQTTKPKLHLIILKAITLVLDKKNTWVSFCHFIICNTNWCMNTNESQHNSFANPNWASDSVHSHRGTSEHMSFQIESGKNTFLRS